MAEQKKASKKTESAKAAKAEDTTKTVKKKSTTAKDEVVATEKKSTSKKAAVDTAKPKATTEKVKAPAEKKTSTAKDSSAKTSVKSAEAASTDSVQQSFLPEYMVLMNQDPNWLHAFWEVNEKRKQEAKAKGEKMVLRLYDVSVDQTVKRSKKKFEETEIPYNVSSWYIQRKSESQYAEVGVVNKQGHFEPVVQSNPVGSPQEFKVPAGNDVSSQMFRASLGGAVSLKDFLSSKDIDISQELADYFAKLAASPSSESYFGALTSSDSMIPAEGDLKGKDFWMWVKTRLIVYGATMPDARLTVRGQPYALNPDGTFYFEMDLPDSTQIIPIHGVHRDGDLQKTITPIVVKRTE